MYEFYTVNDYVNKWHWDKTRVQFAFDSSHCDLCDKKGIVYSIRSPKNNIFACSNECAYILILQRIN